MASFNLYIPFKKLSPNIIGACSLTINGDNALTIADSDFSEFMDDIIIMDPKVTRININIYYSIISKLINYLLKVDSVYYYNMVINEVYKIKTKSGIFYNEYDSSKIISFLVKKAFISAANYGRVDILHDLINTNEYDKDTYQEFLISAMINNQNDVLLEFKHLLNSDISNSGFNSLLSLYDDLDRTEIIKILSLYISDVSLVISCIEYSNLHLFVSIEGVVGCKRISKIISQKRRRRIITLFSREDLLIGKYYKSNKPDEVDILIDFQSYIKNNYNMLLRI